MVNPLGGISVYLVNRQKKTTPKRKPIGVTHAEPPNALPNMADLRPMLVKICMPSMYQPARTTKPLRHSPRRKSTAAVSVFDIAYYIVAGHQLTKLK